MSHLSHIQLLFTGGIPLSMLMLHRVADRAVADGSRRSALGLALAAQALSCAYYGDLRGTDGRLRDAACSRRRGGCGRPRRVLDRRSAPARPSSLALTIPFFIPFLRVQQETRLRAQRRGHGALGGEAERLPRLVGTRPRAGCWPTRGRSGHGGEVLFPGCLAVAARRGRARDRAAPPATDDRETALLYGTLGVLAFWSSFGPRAGLYRVLYYLPTFSFLRAPSRLGLVVRLVPGDVRGDRAAPACSTR